jgi:hypothetical protein
MRIWVGSLEDQEQRIAFRIHGAMHPYLGVRDENAGLIPETDR